MFLKFFYSFDNTCDLKYKAMRSVRGELVINKISALQSKDNG